ncbi:MAG TPA: hypothetical protein VFT61_08150 [Sphingomicrobium sp.]|jgi:hypothetical protein|nr:hypothetical protein [Sphingomicrobium sp.]
MKFLTNKSEPQSAEDTAFAQRLSAIANRGKGIVTPEPAPEFEPSLPAIEQRFWNPSDLPDHGEHPAAA